MLLQHLRPVALPVFLPCLVGVAGCAREQGGPPGGGMQPQKPPEVIVAPPVRKDTMDYEECTGRTEAFKTVEVRARVTGYLQKVNFVEGKKVKKGEVLFEIDARPYEAELTRAEANV